MTLQHGFSVTSGVRHFAFSKARCYGTATTRDCSMEWFGRLPRSIAFVDVKTPGLNADDRIGGLAAFCLTSSSLCDPLFPVTFAHLIFNPARRSHPRAAQVHGYSDWLLKQQEPFE